MAKCACSCLALACSAATSSLRFSVSRARSAPSTSYKNHQVGSEICKYYQSTRKACAVILHVRRMLEGRLVLYSSCPLLEKEGAGRHRCSAYAVLGKNSEAHQLVLIAGQRHSQLQWFRLAKQGVSFLACVVVEEEKTTKGGPGLNCMGWVLSAVQIMVGGHEGISEKGACFLQASLQKATRSSGTCGSMIQ